MKATVGLGYKSLIEISTLSKKFDDVFISEVTEVLKNSLNLEVMFKEPTERTLNGNKITQVTGQILDFNRSLTNEEISILEEALNNKDFHIKEM